MESKKKTLSVFGLALFFIGAFIGIIFVAALIWPTLEADFYFGYRAGADTKMKLSCPRIITPQDHAAITATIANKVDKPISPRVEANLSGPVTQTFRSTPTIDPGKRLVLRWPVGAEQVDFGHLILAQVYQFSSYATGTAMGQCGSLFLFIPVLTGTAVYILSFVLSMALLLGGLFLWRFGRRGMGGTRQERYTGMLLLVVLMLAGIIVGTLAQWIVGVFIMVGLLLMFWILIVRSLNPA
jgi:hypothetical protein